MHDIFHARATAADLRLEESQLGLVESAGASALLIGVQGHAVEVHKRANAALPATGRHTRETAFPGRHP
jgi:hypothetical protein